MRFILIFLVLIQSAFGLNHEVIPDCYLYFSKAYKNQIEFGPHSELKVLSYNTLNLKKTVGKYKLIDGKKYFEKGFHPKPEWQTKWIAKIIKDQDPDIMVLQEIEGRQAIYEFNRVHLNNQYEIFYVGGNDARGINVAILMHRRLPFKYELHSHRKLTMQDPTPGKDGVEIDYFSRDFPVVVVKDKNEKPVFLVGGVHLKSQRGRGDDPTSYHLRAAQVENTLEVLDDYKKTYNNIPMLVAGDFNADLRVNPEFNPLKDSFIKDSFDSLASPLANEARITHSFHPRKGKTQYNQLDGIFQFNFNVTKAKVLRYKDPQTGQEKPLAKTWDERETNPSDHFPITATVKLNN